jgi:hypothetical protein
VSSAGTVFVHVGLPKTATTHVQTRLWAYRHLLRDQGLRFLGRSPNDHFLAAVDITGRRFAGYPVAQSAGAMDSLLTSLDGWKGRALISHEMLAGLRPEKIERLLELLDPHPVEVIVGVRDLSEVVPATFQERAKNQRVESWTEFIDGVRLGPAGKHSFWRLQNVPLVVRRWKSFIPPERIHVVTVAHRNPDRDVMLERFATVLGVDLPLHVETTRVGANRSLGSSELRVLQEVNLVTKGRLTWSEYHRLIKFGLVSEILAELPNQERVTLGESERGWIEEQTAKTVRVVERVGCHVVGDLGELGPWGLTDEPHDPDQVPADAVVKAAAAALVGLASSADVGVPPRAGSVLGLVHAVKDKARATRGVYDRHDGLPTRDRIRRTAADVTDHSRLVRRLRRRGRGSGRGTARDRAR